MLRGPCIEATVSFATAIALKYALDRLTKQNAVMLLRAVAFESFTSRLLGQATASTLLIPATLVATGRQQNHIILCLYSCCAASDPLTPLL